MRPIDADALMEELEREVELADDWKTAHEIANVVKYFPTIEPQRMRGKWIECDHEKWVVGVHALRCSECNGGYHLNNEMTIYYWNFCPNCGADMRETE